VVKRVDCKTVRIFAYSSTGEQSNKRSGTRLKTERGWGETLKIRFFSLASYALRACEARPLRARKTLTPRFTDFFTGFEKKTDCFAVYKTRNIAIQLVLPQCCKTSCTFLVTRFSAPLLAPLPSKGYFQIFCCPVFSIVGSFSFCLDLVRLLK